MLSGLYISKVVMLGLDDAGKSTVLRFLKQSSDGIHHGPTIGFNCVKVKDGEGTWHQHDLYFHLQTLLSTLFLLVSNTENVFLNKKNKSFLE